VSVDAGVDTRGPAVADREVSGMLVNHPPCELFVEATRDDSTICEHCEIESDARARLQLLDLFRDAIVQRLCLRPYASGLALGVPHCSRKSATKTGMFRARARSIAGIDLSRSHVHSGL
jgi:hypothetical protein